MVVFRPEFNQRSFDFMIGLVYNAPGVRDEVSLITFWTTYGFYMWLLTAVALLVMIGVTFRLASQVRAAIQRYTTITKGVDGETLDDIWQARALQVAHHDDQLTTLVRQVRELNHSSVQHIGLVRFNPFGDVGGDQSFAVALLDGNHDGVILSSIYSRAGVRIYAKFVQAGTASHTLSDEEEAAIAQALRDTTRTASPTLNP
jgi:hypothetical protein